MRRRPNHLVDVTTPETTRRSLERNIHNAAANQEALVAAANMAMLQGYPALAREGFTRALSMVSDKDDPEQVLLARLGLGTALHALHEFPQAAQIFEETVLAADQHASTVVRGFALAWLADCQASLGHREAAEESLASASACADVVGNDELGQITEAIRKKLARG